MNKGTYRKEYYQKNKVKISAANTAWEKAHWGQQSLNKRRYFLRTAYNITLEQFDAMRVSQNNCCALCNEPFDDTKRKYKPVVDHDHRTNKVRSILHAQCNIMLGIFESETFRRNAERYLDGQAG